jgi:hypothetical protein
MHHTQLRNRGLLRLLWRTHMRRASLIVALTVLAMPAAADARRVPEVWATVNVCDTQTRPNQMGIRGSMTGLTRSTRMFMRFRVQYQDAEGQWRTIKSGPLSDSGWVRIATGRRGEHDAGWSFEFVPPASGGAHVLRGVVSFEWRRSKRVVERTRAFTEAEHPGTAGAEPADFSAETCEIA